MPTCAHLYCRNSTKNYKTKDGEKLSFHRFPRITTVRQLWLDKLQRKDFEPNPRSVLCSKHFKDGCFDVKCSKYPRLHYGAVPTLFLREGSIKKVEQEEEEGSSDGEPEIWSGWHSWPDKEDKTEKDRQKDVSKGLEELEELMDEEEGDEMEDDVGDGKRASDDRNGVERRPQEKDKETKTDVRKAVDCVKAHEKISLDNVTMDSSLTSVRVGDQRMVSMTFQDILNSLIPTQPKDSPKEHDGSLKTQDSHHNPAEVKGHLDKARSTQGWEPVQGNGKSKSSETMPESLRVPHSQGWKPVQQNGKGKSSETMPESLRVSYSQGWKPVQGNGKDKSSETMSESLITPEFKQSLKRVNEAAQKPKDKGAKRKRKEDPMVISIYRKNTVMRIISSKDLPYICGDCGLAFTHASVLQLHAEQKHDYTEPPELIGNGGISSQVVIHRDFENEPPRTKAEVKELQEKYVKAKSSNSHGESAPAGQWYEKVDKSTISVSDSDGDNASVGGNDGGDSNLNADSLQRTSSKTKRKRNRKGANIAKHRDRCHRCPRYFPSLSLRKQHIAEDHEEYATEVAARESWCKKTGEATAGSSTVEVLKCIYCDTFFTDQKNAKQHFAKHCGIDGIKCDVCQQAIQLWKEGKNLELGDLLRKYEGIEEDGQDKDGGVMKKAEGGEGSKVDNERKSDEGSTVSNERTEKQEAEDLIRQSLDKAHRISNRNYFIVKCFECDEQFFVRHHLNKHYREHEKFTCKECGEEFKTITAYQEHLDEAHKVWLCTCLYCPKKFPSIGKLNYHMLGHLGLFQCILCGLTFMSKQSLESHIRGAVKDPNHRTRSDDEHVKYSSSNPFLGPSHDGRPAGRRRGRIEIKEISCQFCERKFGYSHSLRKHIRYLHPKEKVPMEGDGFCCERCGAVLATKSSLNAHLKTHQERTIPCPKPGCGAMFTTKTNLNGHLRSHDFNASKARLFRCDICQGTFKTKLYLDMHMKGHNGEMPYNCSYCSKTFRNVTHMSYHVKRMHTGQLDHECEVCGKGFADPSTLKVHLKIHSTHRPFVCDICSKDFPTELYLRAHRRIHTKPFKCSQCGEGFSQQAPRRTHLKKVHDIEMPVERSKFRGSAESETEPPEEDIAQIPGASVQDVNVAETLVICDSNEDKAENDMISKLLEGML